MSEQKLEIVCLVVVTILFLVNHHEALYHYIIILPTAITGFITAGAVLLFLRLFKGAIGK